jgi:hypothetical protein
MMRDGRAADAIVIMSQERDPDVAAMAMSAAVNALYRSGRDFGNMVLAAHLGAAWCLGQASLHPEPEAATTLKRRARAICFNAAANCWPGWGDEGVAIDDGNVAAGRTLAGLCSELAKDLGLGPEVQGTSRWLIGALELALDHVAEARTAFAEAERDYAALGEDAPQTLMIRAYDALAVKPDGAGRALVSALEQLDALGTEDGQFFASQVRKAEQVLKARRADKRRATVR